MVAHAPQGVGLIEDRPDWWRSAACYEIYPRSFADSDGDGVGDLPGITAHLDYIANLGFNSIWLTPIFCSPMVDGGYDVADYREIDSTFGDQADLDALLAKAHLLGLKVILDIVPNHTSDQHPWFVEAVAAHSGSAARDRYIFRECTDPDVPPNDWQSAFGGSAWSRVSEPDGQPGDWYLHLFAPEQPDLNWENQQVRTEFAAVIRYWFDRGVDGIRIDMAHALFKAPGLPDAGPGQHVEYRRNHEMPFFDQEPLHELYRSWREIADGAPGRALIAEVCLFDLERQMRYVRPDELHQAFNFSYLEAEWSATALRSVITESLAAAATVGTVPTWVIGSHDSIRPVTRFGGGNVGRRRARAAALLMLALPGGCYVYQGEELGLEQVELADEARRDPVWERSGHTNLGRDGSRIPMPWAGDSPPFGFSPPGSSLSWLPQPDGFAQVSVSRQQGDPTSVLSLYESALGLRSKLFTVDREFTWIKSSDDVIAFVRGGYGCAVNFGSQPWPLPSGWQVLLRSVPPTGVDTRTPGEPEPSIDTDTAVWFALCDRQLPTKSC